MKINLKSKSPDKKVKATFSTNAPGINKKKTQIQGGKEVVSKEAYVNLPKNSKSGTMKGTTSESMMKLQGKFQKKGKVLPTGRTSETDLKNEYGNRLAKKTIKTAKELGGRGRYEVETKSTMVGVKTRHAQSALKKKK